jgi:CBS domain-containing protein
MRIRDLPGGHKPVTTIPASVTVEEVTRLMRADRVGALVISADGHRVDGIITEHDIVSNLGIAGAGALRRTAAQLMLSPAPTCSPDESADEVMRRMVDQRVRHLPVVQDGELIGLVSMGDLMSSHLHEMDLEINLRSQIDLARS